MSYILPYKIQIIKIVEHLPNKISCKSGRIGTISPFFSRNLVNNFIQNSVLFSNIKNNALRTERAKSHGHSINGKAWQLISIH